MATLTIADLDNGKRDLQTVEEVANSRAATATTRFGQQTTTLYEAIRRIVAEGDAQLAEQKDSAETVIRNLGFMVPVPYAPGIEVTESNFTVIGPDGNIYAAQAGQIPFTTGAWDAAQWYPIQNDLNDHKLLVFNTLVEAEAAAATLPDGQSVKIEDDETRDGRSTLYVVQSSELVFQRYVGDADSTELDNYGQAAPKQLFLSEYIFGLPSILQCKSTADANATAMFQRAADVGGRWQVPDGVYDISGVKIRKKFILQCGPGVLFRRPSGTDIRQSSWNDGVACFEVDRCGAKFHIVGGFEFDGQESLQIADEPTGWFARVWAAVDGTESIELRLENPVFRSGTSGYVLARGDDVRRRWETRVDLVNPVFYDTRLGYGKGDPATTNPLGYLPDYVQVLDYVRFTSFNFYAEWLGAIPLNRYAAAALRGTFFGTDYAQSGESIIAMYGDTRVKRLGRSGRKFDNPSDYLTNNGIGAIDCYGNVESIFVENLIADDCENVPLRAKASIKNYTCLNAVLNNCHRGLQVSPSTTGPCEAVVNIGNVTSYGGTVPQVEITGTSTTDRIPAAAVGALNFYGAFTNPEALTASSNGNLHIRNVSRITLKSPKIYSSPVVGTRIQDVVTAELYGPVSRSSTQAALLILGVEKLSIHEPDLQSSGGPAISVQASATASKIDIYGGKTRGSVDNAILNLATNAEVNVYSFTPNDVSGLSRGFSNAVGSIMRLIGCGLSGVTTPIVNNGSSVLEFGNSWNPNIRYGTSYLTTIGTAKLGDIVYNTAPAPGGNVGWICIATGSPGTWRTFGTIAA